MQPKECFYRDQFGYCWMDDGQWVFQAVDAHESLVGEPITVELADIVFHHDEDEELH